MITRLVQWLHRVLDNHRSECRAREFDKWARIARSRGHSFLCGHFTNAAAQERAKKRTS